MGTNKGTIGVKAQIDGGKEFKQDLNNIADQFKTLKSEMKLTESQFDKNDKSVNALSAKNKVLAQSMELQQQKVETLNKALQSATNKYGESNKEVEKFKQQLNYAQAELNKTTSEFNQNEKSIDEMKDSFNKLGDVLDDVKDKSSRFGDIVKGTLIAHGVLEGVKALGNGLKSVMENTIGFTQDSQKAMNNLQSKTGATNEEMVDLKNTMEEIYANNFGESIDDVASSMAEVKQQTDLTGEALKDTTKNALLLRDTFDFDVSESIRAVDTMMQQFGINATEAYNLIAQGAQSGLNQSGDLLDIVNEYSVQYAKAGLSAEEMFNMINNGAKTGAWSIDKMGDAYKEFTIRMNNGDASSGLSKLGLDAGLVVSNFQKGGESAKKSMKQIVEALKNCDDETDQYNIGVQLMGTMYEDMGLEASTALLNVQGEISNTVDALDQINKTRYNDFGSTWSTLGRTIQEGLVQPLTDKLQPVLNDITNDINNNKDEIIATVSNISDKVMNFVTFIYDNKDMLLSTITGVGAGFVTWNVVSTIDGVVKAVKEFQLANEGATIAQSALNLAIKSNPVGLILTGLIGVTGALATYVTLTDKSRKSTNQYSDEIGKLLSKTENLKDSIADVSTARADSTDDAIAEANATQILADKIYALSDKENKSALEKKQMSMLVDELNTKIPNLNLAIDNQTGSLTRQKNEVDALINANKDLYITQALQGNYSEIAKTQAEAEMALAAAQESRISVQKDLAQAQQDLTTSLSKYNEEKAKANDPSRYYDFEEQQKISNLRNKVDSLNSSLEDTDKIIQDSNITISKCGDEWKKTEDTISKHNNIDDTAESINSLGKETKKTSSITTESLQEMKDAYKESLTKAKSSIDASTQLFDEFAKAPKKSKAELQKNLESQLDGLRDWEKNITNLSGRVSEEFLTELKEMGVGSAGEIATLASMTDQELKKYQETWEKKNKEVTKASKLQVSEQKEAIDKGQKEITAITETNAKEMKEKSVAPFSNIQSTMYLQGQHFGKGFANGIKAKQQEVKNSSDEMAKAALEAAQTALDIHSPSKKAQALGEYYAIGLANGIKAKKEYAKASASEIAEAILSKAQKHLDNYKVYHTVSLKDEIAYWDAIRKQCKKGTQARIDADKEYFEAKKALKAQEKELKEQEKKLREEEIEAEQEKADKIKSINSTYKQNVKDTVAEMKQSIAELKSAYESQLSSTASSITSKWSMFSAYTPNTDNQYLSKALLQQNLTSQVHEIESYSKNLDILRSKGVNQDFVDEIEAMGIDANDQIKVINTMTDAELDIYVQTWAAKQRLAKTESEKQLKEMKESTNEQISDIVSDTNKTLQDGYKTYVSDMEKQKGKVSQKLKQYKDSYGQYATSLSDTFSNAFDAAQAKNNIAAKIGLVASTVAGQVNSGLSVKNIADKAMQTVINNNNSIDANGIGLAVKAALLGVGINLNGETVGSIIDSRIINAIS